MSLARSLSPGSAALTPAWQSKGEKTQMRAWSWGCDGGKRSSLGFQYDSEWEKGRWEGKVGGWEERGAYGMISPPSVYLISLLWWNTDEGMSLTGHEV